jgi:hypothetical protein
MRKIFLVLALSLVMVLGLALQAPAAPITISDGICLSNLGEFTGTIDYESIDATHGTFTVSLKNTSLAANGKITAFVFNNPDNLITDVALTAALPQMNVINKVTTLLGAATKPGETSFQDLVKAEPFPNFDIGVAVGGDNDTGFLSGGDPNGGVPIGKTWSWQFALTGTSMDTLDTNSFVNATVHDNVFGDIFMAVRFRGFDPPVDGVDSDKCTAVPLPASAFLMGSGLLGLLGLAWRRKVRP